MSEKKPTELERKAASVLACISEMQDQNQLLTKCVENFVDIHVRQAHPVTLKCSAHGTPEHTEACCARQRARFVLAGVDVPPGFKCGEADGNG